MSYDDWKPEDLVEEGIEYLRRQNPLDDRLTYAISVRKALQDMAHDPGHYVKGLAVLRFPEVLEAADRVVKDAYDRQQRGELDHDD